MRLDDTLRSGVAARLALVRLCGAALQPRLVAGHARALRGEQH